MPIHDRYRAIPRCQGKIEVAVLEMPNHPTPPDEIVSGSRLFGHQFVDELGEFWVYTPPSLGSADILSTVRSISTARKKVHAAAS